MGPLNYQSSSLLHSVTHPFSVWQRLQYLQFWELGNRLYGFYEEVSRNIFTGYIPVRFRKKSRHKTFSLMEKVPPEDLFLGWKKFRHETFSLDGKSPATRLFPWMPLDFLGSSVFCENFKCCFKYLFFIYLFFFLFTENISKYERFKMNQDTYALRIFRIQLQIAFRLICFD